MNAAPRCPSCGRPLAVRLARCPYCGEAMPGAVRRRVLFALAATLPATLLALAACRLSPALPGAFAAVFRSPAAAAGLSIAAVAIFATFPAQRPGVASLSMPSILAELALRAAIFALVVISAAIATAFLSEAPR